MGYPAGRKNRLIEYTLYLGCLLSNISQLPLFVRTGLTQRLAFPGWILVVGAICLSRRVRFYKAVKAQLGLGLLFVIWLVLDSLLISKIQFRSSFFYSYLIALFIFLLGSCSSEYIDERVLRNINSIFVASITVVSVSIFFEYFGIGYNLATRLYAYSSKNSISQIMFTAVILMIVKYKPKRVIEWVLKVAVIAFELYIIILLRSRATLISLILCILIMVFARDTSKRVRIAITIVGATVIILLLTNDDFNNFIFNNVLFAGRDASDLNELSSGRVNILSQFPKKISGNWITGVGPTYYECFPLSAILQFGLLGGMIAILISLQPMIKSFKLRHISDDWYLLFLIAVGYSANGLFEGLTPFGPGVKCYYMWLLFGILAGKFASGLREGPAIVHG